MTLRTRVLLTIAKLVMYVEKLLGTWFSLLHGSKTEN